MIVQFISLLVNFLQEAWIDRVISLSSLAGRLYTCPILGGGTVFLVERNSSIMQCRAARNALPSLSVTRKIAFLKASFETVVPAGPSLRPPSELITPSSVPLSKMYIYFIWPWTSAAHRHLEIISSSWGWCWFLWPIHSTLCGTDNKWLLNNCESQGSISRMPDGWDWSKVKKPKPPVWCDEKLLKGSKEGITSWGVWGGGAPPRPFLSGLLLCLWTRIVPFSPLEGCRGGSVLPHLHLHVTVLWGVLPAPVLSDVFYNHMNLSHLNKP